MPARSASAVWNGGLRSGSGTVRTASGAVDRAYSFTSRFEEGEPAQTNPEELIAAAHAGCYSMALSAALERAGHPAQSVETTATVHLSAVEGGFAVTRIDLRTVATVPGLSADEFQKFAQDAKTNCPISKALSAVEITLDATLN